MRSLGDRDAHPGRRGEVGATLPELVVAAALLLSALGLTATVLSSIGALQQVAVGESDAVRLHAAADRVVRLVRSARPSEGEAAVTVDGGALRLRSATDGASQPRELRILIRDGALVVEPMGHGASVGASILLDGLDGQGSALVALSTEGRPVEDGEAAVLVAVDLVLGEVVASRIVRTVDGMGR